MSRTVTALFDSRPEAEEAKTRLQSSRIDADRIRIIDQSSGGSSGNMQEEPGEQGFMASLKDLFMPDDDAHAYGEGIKRGGYLVCAQVDEDEADEACRVLEQSNSVDFDQRQEQWRSEGWQAHSGGSALGMTGGTGTSTGLGATSQRNESDRTIEEERIPLVEEELRVGKREVARGGARVRSYVRETPVHEQVNLREEHVSVERRPVNETLGRGELDRDSDLLRDRTIEMTETAEEAVVSKEARVREELVVKKTAEEHVEQIDDTVRRTEVDVEEGTRSGEDRSAFSGFGGSARSEDGSSERSGTRDGEMERSGYDPRIDKSGL
jgi:uncharacterized protein (TIGR02271 family)